MRVAYWRDGGEPRPTRIAIIAPCHRFQRAGINTCTVVADGLSPIGVSAHLRFSFKPIVKIAPIFSVAEFALTLLTNQLIQFSTNPCAHLLVLDTRILTLTVVTFQPVQRPFRECLLLRYRSVLLDTSFCEQSKFFPPRTGSKTELNSFL